MKWILLFLICLTSPVFGQSDNGLLDSLERALDSHSNKDTLKIETLLRLAEVPELTFEEQIEYASYALKLSERLESPRHYVASSELLTTLYYFDGDYVTAESYAVKAVEIARINRLQIPLARSLINLGEVEDLLGKDQSSVDHLLEGVEILEELTNYEELIRGYISLAGYYYYREFNDQALAYYEEAKTLLVEHTSLKENYISLAVTESNIGWVYYYQGKLPLAIVQLENAVNIYETYEKNSTYAGNAHASLSTLYSENGNFDLAIEEAQRSIDIAFFNGYTRGLQIGYEAMGEAYLGMKDPRRARSAFLEALDAAKKVGDIDGQLKLTRSLAEVFVIEGNFEKAYNYLAVVEDIKDSLAQEEIQAAYNESVTKYETEKTEAKNEILKQQNKIESLQNKENKAKLSQSRIIIFSSVFGLLLVVGFAAVLYNRNVIKQKANLELQNANEIIQEKNNDITASIEYASKIQEALLPTRENEALFTDSFFILMPKDIVSGDFLWYSQSEDKVIFSAADCTGHGVPGAFMSMIGNTFLHQIVNESKIHQPSIVLDVLREKVITALHQQGEEKARKDGMDMALCCLDKKSLEFQYAGANNPLYLVHKGEMNEIKPDKQPVGHMPERSGAFTNHKMQLEKGDVIYIFSDGYADQFGGPKGKKFKYKQLRDLLFAIHNEPMQEQKKQLITVFNDWKGNLEQIDDVCIIGVRV